MILRLRVGRCVWGLDIVADRLAVVHFPDGLKQREEAKPAPHLKSLKSTALAVSVLVGFMGTAAMAAPVNGPGVSNPLNAGNSLNGPSSAGIQVAVVSGAAAAGVGLQSAERPPRLTLAKQKPSDKEICATKCRKAYRYCYSQGNQIGKPYVTGGQPCSEQKLMCMRACTQ